MLRNAIFLGSFRGFSLLFGSGAQNLLFVLVMNLMMAADLRFLFVLTDPIGGFWGFFELGATFGR